MQSQIIGIRFTEIGKIYHFDSGDVNDLNKGEHVIVDTARGEHLGEITSVLEEAPPQPKGGWKKVIRRATPRDLLLSQNWKGKEIAAMISCREMLSEEKISGVKIIKAEFNYDGSYLSLLYSSEEDEKINLNNLRSKMQKIYIDSKVEMRQIGPRDVAKILGGLGACGLETRCCTKFLTDFSPISIKMAKAQGISLAPSEITGMCGRLRCCLIYEYEAYAAARKIMPKRKKRVITPKGEGRVVDLNPLTETVVVQLDEEVRGARHSFHRDEIEPWDEREALRRKAAEPCKENCNCGKHETAEEDATAG